MNLNQAHRLGVNTLLAARTPPPATLFALITAEIRRRPDMRLGVAT